MSDLSYWEKRQIENMYSYMEKAEHSADEIANLYLKASRWMSREADKIFERYMTKHNLSEEKALKLINTLNDRTSLDEMMQKLKSGDYKDERKELLVKLESGAYQSRIEHLKQLQNQLDYVMRNIYEQEKRISTAHYVDLANEAYYRTIYDMQQRAQAAFSFHHIDAKVIDAVLSSEWSGNNYSARIWKNTRILAQDLKEKLLINLLTGRTERETAEIIANKFAQGSSNARRLVRTESAYLSTEMNFQAYEDMQIKEYQFLATLDLRTSKICRSLDLKVYKVKDRKMGVNCPPMHPWCRSTTTAVVDRMYLEGRKRAARDMKTGKTILVPDNMNYEEWYEKYVKGNKAAEAEEKKIKNYSADKKQHEKYRQVLGDEVPEKLDDFQNMKYTDSERWNSMKLSFRKGSNANSPFLDLKEPMQLKHVRSVMKDMGIDYGDAKIKIDRREELMGKGLYGWTNPNLKEIQLYPDAFFNREQLVKTLGHERIHVEQVRMWGPAQTHEEALYYERGPQFSEEYWWQEYVRRTGYVNE